MPRGSLLRILALCVYGITITGGGLAAGQSNVDPSPTATRDCATNQVSVEFNPWGVTGAGWALVNSDDGWSVEGGTNPTTGFFTVVPGEAPAEPPYGTFYFSPDHEYDTVLLFLHHPIVSGDGSTIYDYVTYTVNLDPCDASGETPGNGEGSDTPGNGDVGNGEVVENGFILNSAQRMCADQSFRATWAGSNMESLEFALNNTSDDWSSGWLEADPAAGVFTVEVDHHNYDKVGAQVTYTDGTTEQFSADTSNCAAAEAPAPVDPPSSGSGATGGSSGGGLSTAAVTSLPSTGSGTAHAELLALASAGVMLLAGAAVITRLGTTHR